ncbi:MAG: hypothetical protein LBC07_05405 [Elusimicrobiota bacterium]|jgi:hypothetical protein|nr:hypothetical protein [Elusimicrobiota bacterium]
MKSKIFGLSAFLVLSFALFSCGGGSQVIANSNASPITIVVLESVPNIATPDWVNNTDDFWEANGNYLYRGMAEGMTNMEASRRSAQASAVTQIAEQVKATVRVEFSRALESEAYDEATGIYLKDVFFSVVDNLTLSGVAVKGSYSQRISETNRDTGTTKVYYRSYVLAQLSQQDFKKLVATAFDKTSTQMTANKSAKELAKEVEDRFFAAQGQ